MGWSDVSELVKVMGAVATACAAWFAAYTAYRGLQKWRDETLGKRNTELAEQVLASFYEARDVFTWVRAPVRSLGEGASRSAGGPESDDLKQKRDSYFTPIERLRQEKELFAKLHAQRYMFAAYFGEADARPFAVISNVHNDIINAASILMEMATEHETRQMIEQDAPLRDKLGCGPTKRPDDMDKSIETAVADIEAICQPVLQPKR